MTQWSPQQDAALKAVDNWYKNDRKTQQVFRLFGYAGTGKTTLAKHFAKNIDGHVKFATFTGKAAHVMEQKGCQGATTIHRLIYRPKGASKNHLKILEKRLKDLQLQRNEPNPQAHIVEIQRVEKELAKERENVGRMSFSLNLESDIKQAKVLIVDECSMVSEDCGRDLQSFGVPILVLGDPEQLPPVYGAGYFTAKEPNFMLTEIHRQALDNPIIGMSKMVREGKELPLGAFGDSRVVNTKLKDEEVLKHNIILTGLRRTKKACDIRARQILGHTNPYPIIGDKVMCIKNNYYMNLLNGQIWNVMEDGIPLRDGTVSLHLKDPDSEVETVVSASEKLILGNDLDKWEHEEDIQEFEYAYAITVHKAQGSQWDNVLVYDQKDKFPMMSKKDRQRWLYTAITRAAENVTVMKT